MKRRGKFIYWKIRKEWFFHYRAGNGEIVAPSEGYLRKRDCLHAINVLKATDADTPIVSRDARK